jgi:hypothetical protein
MRPSFSAAAGLRLAISSALLLAVLLGLPACFTSADGRRPEGAELYFPTGLLVSPGNTTLYVANSDFDLRFSGGSVQAIDLAALRNAVGPIALELQNGRDAADACWRAGGFSPNPEGWLYPGPCAPIPLTQWVRNSALIGAFASGLLLTHRADSANAVGARLFVPVRGDPSITYLDVDDDRPGRPGAASPTFRLDCAVDGAGFCGTAHRLGQDRDRTLRGIQLPADPVGIAANADGDAVVSAHQTQQAASLVRNRWDQVPVLTYFTSSLPTGPTEVAAVPRPALVEAARAEASLRGYDFQYRDGFLVTFRAASQIDLLHYVPDEGSTPDRSFLVRAGATAITANVDNFDSRGIALLDRERRECEQSCGSEADLGCLWGCAEVPVQVFAANRNPASLLIGELTTVIDTTSIDVPGEPDPLEVPTGITESLWFYDSVPLAIGASRVEVGHVIGEDGSLEPRVFAVCFDSRVVFIFDPQRSRIEASVRTGRGPHDVAVDAGIDGASGEPYSYLYVGHFTDSYIGVVDLDLRRPRTYGQMFATVGTPRSPQEAK